jgi:hypothetical protein
MKKQWVIIGLLALSIGRISGVWSAEEHEHKKGTAKIPDSIGGIWHEVKQHEEELGKIIKDKKLNNVHEIAFEIRDLVNALPDKSKDLTADKLARVKANAKFVSELAERLDKSGDANDQAGTESNFKKLQGILKTIEMQYPTEKLK